MAPYNAPGVYIEEISLFPPSVAEVETAVPAFIGYTAKADEFGPDDLRNVPTKVTSLLEYEQLFGGGPPINVKAIVLDENNVLSRYDISSTFYMYDSLRMFFKNGGGKCYIISIGSYQDTVTLAHFENGLGALKKKDEPTIILFPDAVLFEGNHLYDIQRLALEQCNVLQDRFAVFDLLESKTSDPTFDWGDGIVDFRDNIGINYLKYGAAYTPWLKTNLGISVKYRDVRNKIKRGDHPVSLAALTKSQEVIDNLTNLDKAVDDVNTIKDYLTDLKDGEDTLRAKYVTLLDDFKSDPTTENFQALFTFIYDIVDKIDDGAANRIKGSSLNLDVKNLITGSLKASMETLIAYDRGADTSLTGAYNLFENYHPVESTEWGNIFDSAHAPAANVSIFEGTDDTEKMQSAEPSISLIFTQTNAVVNEILNAAHNYEKTYEAKLFESHAVYKNMIVKLSNGLTTLPPSGAVAGIYAQIDRTRGVWKAPANVNLSGVVGPTEIINDEEQDGLNVDVVSGKSINAIRAFTGRGTIVWGARTLAGNDNEWRYISVRRFFNMVEESVKKSTYWAVFEPNNANTWIKVKSMIENYLIQKWRDGALVGAKPDQAFFVKVGLGTTMTAQDILEGRMNVEIGMAVVRPAEFIVLKFSHKMQES